MVLLQTVLKQSCPTHNVDYANFLSFQTRVVVLFLILFLRVYCFSQQCTLEVPQKSMIVVRKKIFSGSQVAAQWHVGGGTLETLRAGRRCCPSAVSLDESGRQERDHELRCAAALVQGLASRGCPE